VRVEIVVPFFVFVTVTDKDLVSRHFVPSLRTSKLVTNPLHIFEEDLLAAAVIEFRDRHGLKCSYEHSVGQDGSNLFRVRMAIIFPPVGHKDRRAVRDETANGATTVQGFLLALL
jgi:hypothetical protein